MNARAVSSPHAFVTLASAAFIGGFVSGLFGGNLADLLLALIVSLLLALDATGHLGKRLFDVPARTLRGVLLIIVLPSGLVGHALGHWVG